MNNQLTWISLWLTVAIVGVPAVSAQEHPALQRGHGAGSFDYSELETISHMNGNLTLQIKLGKIPL